MLATAWSYGTPRAGWLTGRAEPDMEGRRGGPAPRDHPSLQAPGALCLGLRAR